MTIKNLFVSLSCTAIFCVTFFASIAFAQILADEKPLHSDSFFSTGIAGVWRLNAAESDDVAAKIGELLKNREAAPTGEKTDDKQSEKPALSVSLFAPDVLILANGDADEMTIDEFFKTAIESRTVSVDGALREYEIVPGAKVATTATAKTDGLIVETVSPRGNKMRETFRLAEGGARLVIVVRIERAREVLNLRRVYDRAPSNISFVAE